MSSEATGSGETFLGRRGVQRLRSRGEPDKKSSEVFMAGVE